MRTGWEDCKGSADQALPNPIQWIVIGSDGMLDP